jgi:hypothetical protein
VSPPTSCNPNQRHHIPVGLDSYSMIDLVSISFAELLGLSPCDKKKHQHEEPIVEGIGQIKPRTYGFYHLRLFLTDRWGRLVSFIRPFLAIERSPGDSQVLLGRPTLKDLKISINNSDDSWEIENLP